MSEVANLVRHSYWFERHLVDFIYRAEMELLSDFFGKSRIDFCVRRKKSEILKQ